MRRLIHARRNSPVLAGEDIEFFADDFAGTNLVRYRRWDDNGSQALIALNFGGETRQTSLPFPDRSHWWEVVTDNHLSVTGDAQRSLLLPPWQGRVFLPR